ncbi:MAG: sarcosine oxidase subunit gamma [Aestuariivirgaceae bacterium]
MPDPASPSLPGRALPLKQRLSQGRHGATLAGGPGVRLSVRHPLSIATIIARKNEGTKLSTLLEGRYGIPAPAPGKMEIGNSIVLQWCAAEQFYALAENRLEGGLYAELKDALNSAGSVSDQSHGRVVIGISGQKARALLSKGSPVDFHAREFGNHSVAVTQMAHVGVHVSRWGEDAFELSLFRGFSEHFWEWLSEQAEEFGYETA